MKNFKSNLQNGLIAAVVLNYLVFSFVATPVALAATRPNFTPSNAAASAAFCSVISAASARIQARLQTRNPKVDIQKQTITQNLASRRQAGLVELASKRVEWDGVRAQHYTKMLERSGNDAQKAAISSFKESVEVSVAKRRASVDEALNSYFTQSDTIVASQAGNAEILRANFENSVNTAITQAKSQCSAGADAATIRQSFASELQAAYDSIDKSRSTLNSSREQLAGLRQSERAAIAAATEAFKRELAQERDSLRDSLRAAGASEDQISILQSSQL